MYKPALFCSLFLIAIAATGCKPDVRLVKDPNSPTVQLRDELMDLARGNIDRLTGATKEGEGYVLMYGYETESRIRKFPLSATLCDKLDGIRPPHDTEVYVLARYRGDEVLEYTRWLNGETFPYHPNYITLLHITGNPYAYKLDGRNLIKLN
jgi:hypothetical protein